MIIFWQSVPDLKEYFKMSNFGREVIGARDDHYKRILESTKEGAKAEREKEDKQIAEKEELKFLRFFYGQVDDFLGTASDDCYDLLNEQYKETTGREVPEGY